jgi:hypothetical protein
MKYLDKATYKERFPFYHQVTGLVMILSGVVEFFVGFFGYQENIYCRYCTWNIKEDIKRRKKTNEKVNI